ncbi:MAG: (2Fe-2S)-binding protein [Zoogloeaceae bacterium]|nr:(2Fe-2S)-binding protein [Rhodocyclaceae bacterium]MCP5235850.1 (2Fe-2S)-binding protein [Zoogloeaceae bacterium]
MPNITFTSPEHRDKTVYAPAGSHKDTILKVAKANRVPIEFSCEDGECGTCLVKVTVIDAHKKKHAGHLTPKERTVLKELKKVTQQDLDQMDVTDIAPDYRLACQCIVRDEDILVEYGTGELS